MSKRSPSADDDYHDRFQATKSRKWSSNKGGGGGSIQSNKYTNISAHGDSIKEALEIQCLGLGRGEVPYVSPSTDEEKSQALGLLIFVKEKRNGDIKARSCANGSVQREHIAKDEAASPTVALESVFTTATIDAREKREVVTIDIPGAFLHADNDDYVIMRMTGTLAELMAKTDPKLYRKYLSVEKRKKVLYLRLQKALYGMMKSLNL